MSAVETAVVTARPHRTSRIGWIGAAFVLLVFLTIAAVMTRANAGANFRWNDRIGTVVIGIILAGLCIMPTRPRLRADASGVHLRNFLGGYRHIPWEVIVRIDFPSEVRFARVVFAAEETLPIYAVQRWDRQRAVTAMRGLRELFQTYGTPHR
jgi:hypothetical protein